MKNQSAIDVLSAQLEQRQLRIAELQENIKMEELAIQTIKGTIDLLSGKQPDLSEIYQDTASYHAPIKLLHPSDAIMKLFEDNPDREIKHAEISQHLETMYKQGLLQTKTSKIFVNFGYLVQRMVEDGKIENIGVKNKPVYRLIKRS